MDVYGSRMIPVKSSSGLFLTWCLAVLLSIYTWGVPAHALDLQTGLSKIESQQQSNGSWNNRVRDSVEVLKVLRHFSRQNTLAFDKGLQWLKAVSDENTDITARKIAGLHLSGSSGPELDKLVLKLAGLQNLNGGWGENQGSVVDMLSTLLAVESLLQTGFDDQIVIDRGLAILILNQNLNGSWSIVSGGKESIFLTASILSLMIDHKERVLKLHTMLEPQLKTQISSIDRAVSWLTGRQKTDGGWGDDQNSIQETALSYLALLKAGAAPADLDRAIAYLKGRVDPVNWLSDPYLTSLALLALSTENKPDLAIQDASLEPEQPAAGDTVTVNLKVANLGRVAVDATTIRIEDGQGNEVGGAVAVQGLGSGSQKDVTATVSANSVGVQKLVFIVDPGNAVDEAAKNNNRFVKEFEVLNPPDLAVHSNDIGFILANGATVPPEKLRNGMSVLIRAKVSNLGEKSAVRVPLQATLDNAPIGYATTILKIEGQSAVSVNVPWTVNAVVGPHNLLIGVNAARADKEPDRNNNEAWQKVDIGEKDTDFPRAPVELKCAVNAERVATLTWALNREDDVAGYAVFRNGKIANLANLVPGATIKASNGQFSPEVFGDRNVLTGWEAGSEATGYALLVFHFDRPRKIAELSFEWMDELRTASEYEIFTAELGSLNTLSKASNNRELHNSVRFGTENNPDEGRFLTNVGIIVYSGGFRSKTVGIGEVEIKEADRPSLVVVPPYKEKVTNLPVAYQIAAVDYTGKSSLKSEVCVIEDKDPPVSEVTFPTSGSRVNDYLKVTGTVDDLFLKEYRISLVNTVTKLSETPIRSSAPVKGGVLGEIRVSHLAAGNYLLRLEAEDHGGLIAVDEVPIVLSGEAWSAVRIVGSSEDKTADFPNWSADEKEIVFSWDTLVFNSIWRTQASEINTPQQITLNYTGDNDPSWRPVVGGKSVVFSTNPGDGFRRIFVQDVGSSSRTQLTSGNTDFDRPEWSYNGSKIALTGADKQIYTMNPDGSALTRVTAGGENDFPAWSPDGSTIVFQSKTPEGYWKIRTIPSTGGVSIPITSGAWNDLHPTFLSDGNRVAYVSDRDGRTEIYIANLADTENPSRITDLGLAIKHPRASRLPGAERIVLSAPDGIYLAEREVLPSLDIAVDADKGVAPHTVRFSIVTDQPEKFAGLEWDFDGDGTFEGVSKPGVDTTFVYTFQGRYSAVLRAFTTKNRRVVRQNPIDVRGPPLIAIEGLQDGAVFFTPVSPKASVKDDNPKTTTLKIDGQDLVPGTLVESTGRHTLEVTADDFDGFVTTRTLSFTIVSLAELEAFYADAVDVSAAGISWNPTGEEIAYSANGQLFIADARRLSATRQLTPGTGFNTEPAWSPDGRKIAFVANQNIWIINADGSGIRQLTFSGQANFPTWSPDGSKIAYSSQGDILTFDLGTLQTQTLYDDAAQIVGMRAEDPNWSSAANKIVARFFDPGRSQWILGVVDPAKAEEVVEIPSEVALQSPSWNPAGTYIAAVEETLDARGGVTSRQIKIISLAGGEPMYLTTAGFASSPAWSANGRRIAYRESLTSGVGQVPAKLRVVELNPAPLISSFQPDKNDVSAPAAVGFNCAAADFFGGRLTSFAFDFEGDGVVDLVSGSCAGVSHTYTSGGGFRPTLRVTDDQGAVAEKQADLTVRGAPTLLIKNLPDKSSHFGFVTPDIFVADDDLTLREIKIDGTAHEIGASVRTAGPHDLSVRLQDASGNTVSDRRFFFISRDEKTDLQTVDLGNPIAGSSPLWQDEYTRLIVQILNGAKNGLSRINLANLFDLKTVTPPEDNVFYPDFSADRNTVLFHKQFDQPPFSRIVSAPVDGSSGQTQITDRFTSASEPSASSDGRFIAYVGEGDVYLLNRSTGNSKRLTQTPSTEKQPRFSPDGKRIAFSSNSPGNFDIHVYSLADGLTTQVTTDSSDDLAPMWSADGTKIVYHSVRDGAGQIYLADPAANFGPVRVFFDRENNLFPSLSPGGKAAYISQGKLKVVGPRSDFDGPVVNIDTPAASAVLTTVADIIVTSPDSDVAKVVLNARLQREAAFRKFDEIVVPTTEIEHQFILKLNTNSLPDGAYLLQAAATDRFDNAGNDVIEAVVNNRLPEMTGLAFKVLTDVGGSEALSTVKLSFQIGEESRIEMAIKGRDGTAVKTIKTGFLFPQAGTDQIILWDQRNAFGSIVNEDTYVFELRVVDRADSVVTVTREFRVPGFFRPVSAISTGKTPVAVAPGDVIRVYNAAGENVLERSAGDAVFVWDGRDRFGAISPVGAYKVTVNGGPEVPVSLEEDVSSPQLSVVYVTDSVFAPLAGETTSVSYRTNEYCPNVLIQIQAEGNKTVKEFVRKGSLSFDKNDTVTWDGIDINNNVAPAGKYTVAIQATDAAGNKTTGSGGALTVDGPPKLLSVRLDSPARISPNADFVNDTVGIEIRVSEPVTYDVMIYSASNALVDNLRGEISSDTGLAVWDGRTGPDRTALAAGFYNVAVEVKDRDGLTARNNENFIEIITVPPIGAPEITEVNDFPDPFSPNGDNAADRLNISYKVSELSDVIIRIFNSSNLLVRKRTVPAVSGNVTTEWDGMDGAGQVVPNGLYTYRIQAEKNDGRLKSLEKEGHALVFVPPVDPGPAVSALRISPDPFSPNNDGQDEVTNVSITLTATAAVTVEVLKNEVLVKRLAAGVSAPQGESAYVWDGKDAAGTLQADGVYTVRVTAVDAKGFKTTVDGSVQINTLLVNDAPIVSGVTVTPAILYSDGNISADFVTIAYQLSEDATLNVRVANDPVDVVLKNALVNKAGSNNSIRWDGADTHGAFLPYGTYHIDLTAVDRFGIFSETRTVHVTQKSFLPVVFDPVVDAPALVSPDADGILDALGLTFFLNEPAEFTVGVVSAATQQRIFSITRAGVEGSNRIVWDGSTTAGPRPAVGQYYFTMDAVDPFGSEAEQKKSAEFTVDYPPQVTNVTAQPSSFSPNADKAADAVQFDVESDKAEFFVTLQIYTSGSPKTLVRNLVSNAGATGGRFTTSWDGRNDAGAVVDNGTYRFEIQLTHATHAMLKSPVFSGEVQVDNPLELHRLFQKVFCFTPNDNLSDGDDVLHVEYTLNLRAQATITVKNSANVIVKNIADNEFRLRGTNFFDWDGKNDADIVVPDGIYRIDFHFAEDNFIDTYITVCKLRYSPLATIDFPAEESVVSGNVVIKGFAASAEPFDRYEVLVGFEDVSKTPPAFVVMKTLSPPAPTVPVLGGDLAEWNTHELKNARYVVRVNVRAAGGAKTATAAVGLATDNVTQLPFNVVTPVATTAVRSSTKFVTGKVGWSPAGNQLVFENDGKIALINIDGSNFTPVTTGSGEPVLAPAWDNQPNNIVYHKANTGDALFVQQPAALNGASINVGQAVPIAGDVSPDGTKIVFTAVVGANNPEIFLVSTSGGVPTRITTNTSFEDNPTFSPDGKKIAFSSNMAGGPSNFDIWVYDTTNGVFTRLTEEAENELFPSWSNDGRQVLYESHE